MSANTQFAVGIIQAAAIVFPVWMVISQIIIERLSGPRTESDYTYHILFQTVVIASYGAIVMMIQKVIDAVSSELSGLLIEAIIWFRTWAAISVLVIWLIMTRKETTRHKLAVLVGGAILAVVMNLMVQFDASANWEAIFTL